MPRPAINPGAARRLITPLRAALAIGAGGLAVTAVVASGSGASGLAAFSSAAAMAASAAGFLTWRRALRLVDGVEAIAGAIVDQSDGRPRSPDEVPDEPSDLFDAYQRVETTQEALQHRVAQLEAASEGFRQAVAALGRVNRLASDPPPGAREKPDQTREEIILGAVKEAAQLAVGADQVMFWELLPGGGPTRRLRAKTSTGPLDLSVGTGLAGRVGETRVAELIPGATDLVFPELDRRTAMAVPFFRGSSLLGVIAVYGRTSGGDGFTQVDLEALETLVAQAGTAVENVALHDEAQRLSITDGLTGLWNRRQLELRCQEEIERAIRFNRPVGLVFCDVDRFKSVNDDPDWLYAGGDAVLVEVANRLAAATREIDVVARWGGEEFVLLLPETDLTGATTLAEKVRQAVASEEIGHAGRSRTVTISLGVASFPHSGANVRTLLEAANEALHRAKNGGRNRVEQAEPKIRPTGGCSDGVGAGPGSPGQVEGKETETG